MRSPPSTRARGAGRRSKRESARAWRRRKEQASCRKTLRPSTASIPAARLDRSLDRQAECGNDEMYSIVRAVLRALCRPCVRHGSRAICTRSSLCVRAAFHLLRALPPSRRRAPQLPVEHVWYCARPAIAMAAPHGSVRGAWRHCSAAASSICAAHGTASTVQDGAMDLSPVLSSPELTEQLVHSMHVAVRDGALRRSAARRPPPAAVVLTGRLAEFDVVAGVDFAGFTDSMAAEFARMRSKRACHRAARPRDALLNTAACRDSVHQAHAATLGCDGCRRSANPGCGCFS